MTKFLNAFEGDERTGPRCPAIDPETGFRCALDAGHGNELGRKVHKLAIPIDGRRRADRDAVIREWSGDGQKAS